MNALRAVALDNRCTGELKKLLAICELSVSSSDKKVTKIASRANITI
jgi:hypothetical protein